MAMLDVWAARLVSWAPPATPSIAVVTCCTIWLVPRAVSSRWALISLSDLGVAGHIGHQIGQIVDKVAVLAKLLLVLAELGVEGLGKLPQLAGAFRRQRERLVGVLAAPPQRRHVARRPAAEHPVQAPEHDADAERHEDGDERQRPNGRVRCAGPRVGDLGIEPSVHLLLERDDRGQHRLPILLVLGVGQHATRALGLLLGAHDRFDGAQLVGGERRRHRR